MNFLLNILLLLLVVLFTACEDDSVEQNVEPAQEFTDITSKIFYNEAAYITSMCYTKTTDETNNTFNPCYACHINSIEPNYVNDFIRQESYDFNAYTLKNRFTNLFKDRTQEVNNIDDEEILNYIRENNYINNNEINLASTLKNLPQEWDVNKDEIWNGYMPDCYFNFDDEGFDIDPNGGYTFWRAFAYTPFLGTFWPTNGSVDDVLIRLPEPFYKNSSDEIDIEVYKINLAIVESLIKKEDINIKSVDENIYGVDLNQNGVLDEATKVVYVWDIPKYDLEQKIFYDYSIYFVGQANILQKEGSLNLAPALYPKDTEFLHSVRYLDFDENGTIGLSSRMKELRYAKKVSYNSYPQLQNAALADLKEKIDFPERLRSIEGSAEEGLYTGLGWVYQGFIEDKDGYLRPQTYEENLNCIGCHSGIGAIVDSTFVFPRKLDFNSFQNGWFHYTQHGLQDIKEPLLKDGRREYLEYLKTNPYGDEFRTNTEIYEKFHDENGSLGITETDKFENDITYLLYPSTSRALELNKAYKVIVEEQSFIYGKAGHIKPLENIYEELDEVKTTNLEIIYK